MHAFHPPTCSGFDLSKSFPFHSSISNLASLFFLFPPLLTHISSLLTSLHSFSLCPNHFSSSTLSKILFYCLLNQTSSHQYIMSTNTAFLSCLPSRSLHILIYCPCLIRITLLGLLYFQTYPFLPFQIKTYPHILQCSHNLCLLTHPMTHFHAYTLSFFHTNSPFPMLAR